MMIQYELGTFVNTKIKAFNQEICPMLNVKIFQFNPLQENTYLVYDDQKNCLIFDPGCYFDNERDNLVAFIGEKGLNPVQLWNTHCHLDHVFGNKFIYETYQLELYIHEGEKKVLDRAPESGLMWNVPFDNYVGPGYSLPTESMIEAVKLLAQTESILLDPVYSGKAMAGLIDLVRNDYFPAGSNVLFLHTGGSPALYAYLDTFK